MFQIDLPDRTGETRGFDYPRVGQLVVSGSGGERLPGEAFARIRLLTAQALTEVMATTKSC